tara:strand:- start:46 stop:399 length:354 start_codon:yes stop_codon:yes gene_type:complete
MDIEELGEQLFNTEPRPSNSIQVEFTGATPKELFESFCLLFTFGMKKFHGDQNGVVDISKLSKSDISRMNEYFNSIGINLFINNPSYTRTPGLSEHHLNLKSGGKDWELFFDYLKTN